MQEQELLSLESVSCTLDGREILSDISFRLARGRILGISGQSGSGKTTLARIIAGLIKDDPPRTRLSGTVTVSGYTSKTGYKKPHPVQILFQNNGLLLNPNRKVFSMIYDALRISGCRKNELEKRSQSLFRELELPLTLLGHYGAHLSGGEQQRIALARILAARPDILIADEPFSAQDEEACSLLLDLFADIHRKYGLTLIVISHNLSLLARLAEEMLILHNGKAVTHRCRTEEMGLDGADGYPGFLLKAAEYNLTEEDLKTNW